MELEEGALKTEHKAWREQVASITSSNIYQCLNALWLKIVAPNFYKMIILNIIKDCKMNLINEHFLAKKNYNVFTKND